MHKKSLYCSILLSFLAGSSSVLAADNLTFSGTLEEPALCTIKDTNNASTVVTAFGRVPTNKLGTSEVTQTVQYKISCTKGATGFALGLVFKPGGAGLADEAGTLKTNLANLGVLLRYDNQPVKFNTRYEVTGWPAAQKEGQGASLTATAAQIGGVLPKGDGAFNAAATLEATYQ